VLDYDAGAKLHLHLAPWQARRALSLIETNLAGTIKMGELATSSRLSVGYFSKAFRADFGLSPHEYVIRRRVQRAKELMLVTQKTLACIAIGCGFADQPHFTRLFRRIVGVTPARWRRSRCSEL
jgi:AraC-like DNA-binding protein